MARVTSYRQLDKHALGLLADRVQRRGSRAAVADELGVTRTAVSQALNGKYPADTFRLEAKIIERYAEGVACPHLRRDITPSACRMFRERPLPTSPLAAVKHWQACRHCPNNPNNRREMP